MVRKSAWNRFTGPTRAWFEATFGTPTAAQSEAWEAISTGRHALVISPTGSGKTLAAFLWALDCFQRRPSTGNTRVLYISPLKALGADVARNLQTPLAGIGMTVSVAVRSGDSTAQQRRQLLAHPPDILITTPESLFLLLTSRAADTLSEVETVIVDEIHAMAGTKRGAHLAVSLERLDALLPRPAQRIGLSATVAPAQQVGRFLAGGRPVTIVAPPAEKRWRLTVQMPVPDLTALPANQPDSAIPGDNSIWPHVEGQILDLVLAHRSTLIFVNARRAAERLTARLNEAYADRYGTGTIRQHAPAAEITSGDSHGAAPIIARAHHGSVAKQQRAEIESALKSGALRCVVTTSSLELGIDMGEIDLVIQVAAPPSIAAGLQRVGRAGHRVGAVSRGVLFPKHRLDVVHCAVAVQRMRAGLLEPLRMVTNPLDVLAQQTVAAAAMATWRVADWFELVRRSAPFADLPRPAFEATLDMLAGRYPAAEFAELRPRLSWDRAAGTISGRPGAQRLAVTNAGTIPDRGLFAVYLLGAKDGRRVGELDEEMVYESRVGDVIALGATSWRIEQITRDKVLVSPAEGQPARLPFWIADGPGRPAGFGRAIGEFLRDFDPASLAALGLDDNAIGNATALIAEQRAATGVLPTDRELVVERFTDELGDWRVILHSPYGMPVHAPWALAVQARVGERHGVDGAVVAADDGIVVRLPVAEGAAPGMELFVFDPDELDHLVRSTVASSALFAGRFRECAARALLLPRRVPGRRSPLWQQRLRAGQLFEVASRLPDFPIIAETARECLSDVYDLPALQEIHTAIAGGRIRLIEVATPVPSPMARGLLLGYVAQFMYERDTPLAERRAATLSLDLGLLDELLGGLDLRELLDPAVIEQVEAELQGLVPGRRKCGVEGLADWLRVLGPLGRADFTLRLTDPELADEHAAVLVAAGRAHWQGDLLRSRDDDGLAGGGIGELIVRYARSHGPFDLTQAAAGLNLPLDDVRAGAADLVAQGRLLTGRFRAGLAGEQWCDPGVLGRIRRRCLAALRAAVAPVPGRDYARFLLDWQQVQGELRGVTGLAWVLEQLTGASAPASAWESLLLPARIADYHPAMLDELLGSGIFVMSGTGCLGAADGWLGFHLAETAELTLTRGEFAETPVQAAILAALAGGGRFQRELEAELATPIGEDLWRLFWAGRITNDSYAAVRGLLGGSSSLRRPVVPRPRIARPARHRRHRIGPAVPPGGRWSLLPVPIADPTRALRARAEYLLDRHGVLTRGAESVPGGFAALYKVLSALEERGECRRGYFVADLGAAQFALPGAVDLLRSASAPPVTVVLAACDPANPYGAALPWPTVTGGHRPGRRAGALVVLVAGELALYVERGGRTALCFTADPGPAAAALVDTLRRARVPSMVIDTVNGGPILPSPLASALLAAGCYASHRSVRFRSL